MPSGSGFSSPKVISLEEARYNRRVKQWKKLHGSAWRIVALLTAVKERQYAEQDRTSIDPVIPIHHR